MTDNAIRERVAREALDWAKQRRALAEREMLAATANGQGALQISHAHWGLHDADNAYITALEAENAALRERVAAGLVFTIQFVDNFNSNGLWSAEELAAAKFAVTLNNGDTHLFATVEEVNSLIHDELFLHGFDDEHQRPAPAEPDGAANVQEYAEQLEDERREEPDFSGHCIYCGRVYELCTCG